jgi:ureidoglycolate lyase
MIRVFRTRAIVLTADGKPDLDKVQAFIARGNQGIVYEANRWHSPMCGLDDVLSVAVFANVKIVDFAVVQNENGVPEEDCVEYYLNAGEVFHVILDQGNL